MEKLSFNDCLKSKKTIENKVDEYDLILKSYPVNEMGLISDLYRNEPEYIEAKKQFNFWFKQLQELNLYINRNFKKENLELNKQKRLLKIK